jgi:hypothetical protein
VTLLFPASLGTRDPVQEQVGRPVDRHRIAGPSGAADHQGCQVQVFTDVRCDPLKGAPIVARLLQRRHDCLKKSLPTCHKVTPSDGMIVFAKLQCERTARAWRLGAFRA